MRKVQSELIPLVWGTEEWFRLEGDFEDLLFKIIVTRDKLSVQVHPGDEYAREHEDSLGKTEVWYVLDAEDGAELVYGLKEGVTKAEFAESIDRGIVEQLLNFVPVKRGDVFFISPGLVHAIGGGIKLVELQQNSDITYRVFDYGRKPERELHIDKALDVIATDIRPMPDNINWAESHRVACEYFSMEYVSVDGECVILEDCLIFVVNGEFDAMNAEDLLYVDANERISGRGNILIMK